MRDRTIGAKQNFMFVKLFMFPFITCVEFPQTCLFSKCAVRFTSARQLDNANYLCAFHHLVLPNAVLISSPAILTFPGSNIFLFTIINQIMATPLAKKERTIASLLIIEPYILT